MRGTATTVSRIPASRMLSAASRIVARGSVCRYLQRRVGEGVKVGSSVIRCVESSVITMPGLSVTVRVTVPGGLKRRGEEYKYKYHFLRVQMRAATSK